MRPMPSNAHETHTQIVVSCYDGGGIEVQLQNYRPLSFHCRVTEPEDAADAVATMVRGLVVEWIKDQKKRRRIR